MESTPPQRSGASVRSHVAALGLCLAFLASAVAGARARGLRGAGTSGGSMLDGAPADGRHDRGAPGCAGPPGAAGPLRRAAAAPRGRRPRRGADRAPTTRASSAASPSSPRRSGWGSGSDNVRATVARRVGRGPGRRPRSRSSWPTTSPTATAASTPRAGRRPPPPTAPGSARSRAASGPPRRSWCSSPTRSRASTASRGPIAGERIALLRDAVTTSRALPATARLRRRRQPGMGARGAHGQAPARGGDRAARAASRSTWPASRPPSARPPTARAISRRTGGAHFVIDTSRNGAGPAGPGDVVQPPGPRPRRASRPRRPAIRSSTPISG